MVVEVVVVVEQLRFAAVLEFLGQPLVLHDVQHDALKLFEILILPTDLQVDAFVAHINVYFVVQQ